MFDEHTERDEKTKARWHVLNAIKGSRLMARPGNTYVALGRGIPVSPAMVTELLRAALIERVGRGMYQLTISGRQFVYDHKDEMSLEIGDRCDNCRADCETTAVFRFSCRHHWLCVNCRQIADSSPQR